jgi:glycosyltransferase involved in cell wall biosynthesis
MKNTPFFSIILPTFNGEEFLDTSLKCIFDQNFRDFELIIIDDGSTDNTISIINNHKNKGQINLFIEKHEGNWVKNTNKGICLSSGRYVCLFHQDDYWENDRLDKLHTLIQNYPEGDFFFHPVFFIDSSNKKIFKLNPPLKRQEGIVEPEAIFPKLYVQNFLAVCSTCIRRSKFSSSFLLDESKWFTADWKLWLQLSLKTKTVYSHQFLSSFRLHKNSQTMVRSKNLDELRNQYASIHQEFHEYLQTTSDNPKRYLNAASFSVDVNVYLASKFSRANNSVYSLIIKLVKIRPRAFFTFLHCSRFFERFIARFKLYMASKL